MFSPHCPTFRAVSSLRRIAAKIHTAMPMTTSPTAAIAKAAPCAWPITTNPSDAKIGRLSVTNVFQILVIPMPAVASAAPTL